MSLEQYSSGPPLESYEQNLVTALLSQAAQQQYAQGKIAKAELAPIVKAVQELSSAYVNHKAPGRLSNEMATAYAIYYSPINYAKVWHLLQQIPPNTLGAEINILDYGCGPGTATFAATDFFSATANILAYDQSPAMTAVGQKILNVRPPPPGSRITFTNSAKDFAEKKFDLILAANVLNEIQDASQRWKLVSKLINQLSTKGVLLILEPALQKNAHDLVVLRDQLVGEMPNFSILFPCTHKAPCPMRQQEDLAWCHFCMSWEPPSLFHQLDDLSGFNKHRLKFAALVVQGGSPQISGLRILSEPQKRNGHLEVLACGKHFYGVKKMGREALKGGRIGWGEVVCEYEA